MEDYTYKLEYTNGQTKVTMVFPADVDIWELADRIREFLLAASWSNENVDSILKTEEEI